MKKLLLIMFLSFPVMIFAQTVGSLTVFSENGDKFFLFLDGIKQNEEPGSNIRIEGLPDLYYSAKISFVDASLWAITKNNLYVSDGDDIMRDATYRLHRDKAGKPKLNFYAMIPVQQNFVAVKGMQVFHFGHPAISEIIPVVAVKQTTAVNSSLTKGSLTLFSQNGDKFFLFLNGVKQNDTAQSGICIREIPGLYYNAKIVFQDKKLGTILKNNLFISDGEDNLMDAAYRLRRDKTGKPRLNFYSMITVQPDFSAPAGMYVYNFGSRSPTVEPPAKNLASSNKKTATPVLGKITNIKITDPAASKAPVNKIATVPKKQTNIPGKTNLTNEQANVKEKTVAATSPKAAEPLKSIPENKKCNGWPMGKGDLAAAKKIIEDAGKDEAKLAAAQEVIASNCLLASQVTEFCNMFKSERSKLAFAKYAYKFTIDRKNYAEVNKVLSLETSKKELNKFINGG